MATQVQFRRGTTADISTFIGADGEVVVDTTKKTCVVHDGVKIAGYPLLREDGSNSALNVGSLSSCALKFINDPNTGIISPGADQIALVTGGASRLSVDSSGSVTIPGNLLVSGAFTGSITFDNGSAAVPALRFTNDPDTGIYLAGTNQVAISTGGTQRLTTTTTEVTSTLPVIHPLGAAATPSLTFAGDTNTGIYSPGADQVAISTNGTGRLFVDASGNVGIGTTSPNKKLTVYGTTGTEEIIELNNTTGSTDGGATNALRFVCNSGGNWANARYTAFAHIWGYGGSPASNEAMRIDSSGRLGLGTSSPNVKLTIADGAVSAGIVIPTSDIAFPSAYTNGFFRAVGGYNVGGGVGGTIQLGGQSYTDPGNVGAFLISAVSGGNATDALTFSTQTSFNNVVSERMRLDSSGRLGIGVTSPGDIASGYATLQIGGTNGGGVRVGTSSTAYGYMAGSASGVEIGTTGSTAFSIFTNNAERARIDSSGRLLVGTSTTSATLTTILQGNSSSTTSNAGLMLARGEAPGSDGTVLGALDYAANNHVIASRILCKRDGGTWTAGTSQPTRLEFSTTADGASSPTERMRIDNSGTIKIHGQMQFTDGASGNDKGAIQAFGDDFSNGNLRFYTKGSGTLTERMRIDNVGSTDLTAASGASVKVLKLENSVNVSGAFSLTSFLGSNCNNTSSYHYIANTGASDKYYIYGNGTTGTPSDNRLKKNIETTRDGYLNDLNRLRVVKYNWNDQSDKNQKELGLIAQEVEAVFPGLIQDGPANEDGISYKTLKTSVLPFMLLKALQEATAKIEILEAEVAALKAS